MVTEINLFQFLIRPGCHLCDEARPVVVEALHRAGFEMIEVDIDHQDRLVRDFALRVPVLLAPDGAVIVEGVIDRRGLRRSLRRYRGPG